ncbi:hypothetical protein B0J11DRAFT_87920 [Dendryphion nanum]|uniref:Uncharacterized protein n=1 Tax=Dendryphion nanum TaxID=256645 RepID=A0A9P9DF20_9PLEO|nr:hypothetical protein B0J11DRAFT_87920 [Dendryphion nanum]
MIFSQMSLAPISSPASPASAQWINACRHSRPNLRTGTTRHESPNHEFLFPQPRPYPLLHSYFLSHPSNPGTGLLPTLPQLSRRTLLHYRPNPPAPHMVPPPLQPEREREAHAEPSHRTRPSAHVPPPSAPQYHATPNPVPKPSFALTAKLSDSHRAVLLAQINSGMRRVAVLRLDARAARSEVRCTRVYPCACVGTRCGEWARGRGERMYISRMGPTVDVGEFPLVFLFLFHLSCGACMWSGVVL